MDLLFDFFFILGMLMSGIYMLLLYKSKYKSIPHKILIVIFGVIILVLLNSYAVLHKIYLLSLLTFVPVSGAKFLLGGLLFLYIKSLFYDDERVFRKYWIVFIPLFLFVILYSVPTLIALISKKFFLSHLSIFYSYNFLIRIISDTVLLIYLILCFRTFFKLKKVLKCIYSDITHNNFIWVRYLLIATIVIILLDFVFALFLGFLHTNVRTQNIVMLLLAVSVAYAAYFGLNQSKVLVPYFLLENDAIFKSKRTKQPIDKEAQAEFEILEQKLQQLFLTTQPHLDTDLTLSKLSKHLAVSGKKLSTLLNDYMRISFYDFVNSYRIAAFKEAIKLERHKNVTIEAIAFECGFKSRATFYRIFKLRTGTSPSEFKNGLT